MSAELLATTSHRAAEARWAPPLVAVLGRREGWRMLRSPASLVLVGVVLMVGGIDSFMDVAGGGGWPSADEWYGVITYFTLLYLGLVTYAAAHLVTSSARRTGAQRMLAATPAGDQRRSGGLCSGVVTGPGLLAAFLVGTLTLIGSRNPLVGDEPALSVVELSQLFLVVVGGGLFGVLTASWLRFAGSLPLGLVALVVGTMWLLAPEGAGAVRPWFAPYVTIESWLELEWAGAGSHGWHSVYLLGLCALAVCGVMLRDRAGRTTWVGVSLMVLAATAFAGWAQLP